jgi:hypothetical protein
MIKLTKNQYGYTLEKQTNQINEKTGMEIVEEIVDIDELELYELGQTINKIVFIQKELALEAADRRDEIIKEGVNALNKL